MTVAPPELQANEKHPGKIRRDGEITGWRIRIYYWSRDPQILFFTAMAIVGLGILIGHLLEPAEKKDIFTVLMERMTRKLHGEFGSMASPIDLSTEILKDKPDLGRILRSLASCDTDDEKAVGNVTRGLQLSHLAPAEKNVALAYWQSLCSHLGEPSADLLYFACLPQPPVYANELVGDFLLERGNKTGRAVRHYERELTIRPGDEEVRRKVLDSYWRKKDYAALERLRHDAAYARLFDAEAVLDVATQQEDWKSVCGALVEMQKENFSDKIPLILTCVAGAVWLVLAWQMSQPHGIFSFRILAPLVAIPLGAASTFPVLFLDIYQSGMWGLKENGTFFNDCYFFLAGVGLREELCKLIFFLPFLPVLLRRNCRLETLIVAGAVGLGFAIEENVNYFRASLPAAAFARFLTANFFHFAATGLIGAALCDSIREFRAKWWHFPATFFAVVAAHGFYDAFLGVPGSLFRTLAFSCFILLSLAFFRKVARERGPATDQLFPAATLSIGLAILTATIIACASITYGLKFAVVTMLIGILSLMMFVYIFFVLFRDGLREEEPVSQPNYGVH